ncbi:SAG-related sequence [Besnoitia besnoiti]|uniref:SAG-related sequence n=1 Tax=Besnoitia besnoiti TaxID=94643 RepID=A0A2A9MGJ7_BESBE|nr:SAG-related sequence [Besnoitia besnoiti]PFH37039.1 SAG-related sequence [Besnoitia besnoiti]
MPAGAQLVETPASIAFPKAKPYWFPPTLKHPACRAFFININIITMARLQQRRGGLKSKGRKWMALCACGVLALSSGSAFAEMREAEQVLQTLDEGSAPSPNNVVLCSVAGARTEDNIEHHNVELAEGKLSTAFQCASGTNAVPAEPTQVCVYKSQTLAKCNSGGTSLTQLLGTSNNVTWTKESVDLQPKNKAERRTLQLTASDLPFTDTYFFVGCQNSSSNKDCQVDITVKARSSSVAENVVTCAYGSDSNRSTLTVEMTQEKNTLTLACGKAGSITPESYDANYCEDDTLKPCKKSYRDILPKFEDTWWTKETKEGSPVVLTIPKEGFPESDQQFYVGCILNPVGGNDISSRADQPAPSPADKVPTPCKVHVTVKAAGAASAAPSIARAATAAASGAVGFAGLFSRS